MPNDSNLGPRAGLAKCLRCGNKFDSIDVTRNRICPSCTRINDKEYTPRIISSTVYTYDGPSSISADD